MRDSHTLMVVSRSLSICFFLQSLKFINWFLYFTFFSVRCSFILSHIASSLTTNTHTHFVVATSEIDFIISFKNVCPSPMSAIISSNSIRDCESSKSPTHSLSLSLSVNVCIASPLTLSLSLPLRVYGSLWNVSSSDFKRLIKTRVVVALTLPSLARRHQHR